MRMCVSVVWYTLTLLLMENETLELGLFHAELLYVQCNLSYMNTHMHDNPTFQKNRDLGFLNIIS